MASFINNTLRHFKMLRYVDFSEIKDTDVITPEAGRAIAKEVGAAAYYETSVLDNYGIGQVFVNVTRAALINRREKHFWNMLGNLKRISRPLCQVSKNTKIL